MTLNSKQLRHLRSVSHALNPVVVIGNNGLSQSVLNEIDRSLNAHELIKIKVSGHQRELRVKMLQEVCQQLGAIAVQHIGRLLIVYRPLANPKIVLPKS